MVLANDGVAFPIAYTNFLLNDLWPFINADPVTEGASPFLSAGIALVIWRLTAQMLAQVSATSFIRIDVPVNNFVADRQATFQLKP